MAIDKLTPRYLNKDDDYRLVKSVELTDALNIRVSTDSNGNAGVIKNIKGNTAISLAQALPTGTNRVIGAYAFDREDEFYFFVWNSNDNHCIYRYNVQVSASAQRVLQGSYLQFQPDVHLNVDGIKTGDGQIILYFNDGITEPKKVNVTSALNPSINYPAGSTDAEKLLEIAVAKQPPLTPPSIEVITDVNFSENNIYDKMFQFSYQYIYRDGEYSAMGPYSEVAFGYNAANDAFLSPTAKRQFNVIRVTMPTSTASVDKLRLLARRGNEGAWFEIDELDVVTAGTDVVYDFKNQNTYSYVSADESNKLYDSVPKKAQAQTISNNRLIYGNITEGFDVTMPTVELSTEYIDQSERSVIELTAGAGVGDKTWYLDLSSLPDYLDAGSQILISFSVKYKTIKSAANPYGTSIIWKRNGQFETGVPDGPLILITGDTSFSQNLYVSSALADKAAIAAFIISEIENSVVSGALQPQEQITNQGNTALATVVTRNLVLNYLQFAGSVTYKMMNFTYDSNTDSIEFYLHFDSVSANVKSVYRLNKYIQGIETFESISLAGQSNFPANWQVTKTAQPVTYNASSLVDDTGLYTSFKSNCDHSFGIVYYDNRGRSSGVQKVGSVFVDPIGSANRVSKIGNAYINVEITGNAPSWATKYSIVYGGRNRYSKYLQYTVDNAYTVDNTSETVNSLGGDVDTIYVPLHYLQGKQKSYVDSTGADIEYAFVNGDKLRVISYRDAAGDIIYPQGIEFEIIALATFDDAATSPIYPDSGNAAHDEFHKTGQFLALKNEEYQGFSFSDVNSLSHLWDNNVLVEIYSPLKEVDEAAKVYYETPYFFDINSARKHVGNVATQGVSGATSTIVKLESGDSYFRQRRLYNSAANGAGYVGSIEDDSLSDLFASKNFSKGRANIIIENERELNRTASLAYSDPWLQDSDRLYLSSFNQSLLNYFDLDSNLGGVYGLINMDTIVIALQEDKVAQVPVNRNVISTANGDALLALSSSLFNTPSYFAGTFGIGKTRSAYLSTDAGVFVVDIQRGKVILIGGSGGENIASKGMTAYFQDSFRELVEFAVPDYGIPAYGDDEKRNYIVTLADDTASEEFILTTTQVTRTVQAIPGQPGEELFETIYDFEGIQTVSFDYSNRQWATFYSFTPEKYVNLNNVLYSFNGGVPYSHETNNTYNNFYGTQYDSFIEMVGNYNPSLVKSYESMSIEGSAPWDTTILNTDQTTSILSTDYSERERGYFAYIPRDTAVDLSSNGNITTFKGASEVFSIGEVESVDGENIVFKNRISNISVPIGASVYVVNGSQADTISNTISNISGRNTLVCASAVTGVNPDDIIIAVANSGIEGDKIRDYYARVRMTTTSTSRVSPIELYGVNLVYSRSSLHNELGQ